MKRWLECILVVGPSGLLYRNLFCSQLRNEMTVCEEEKWKMELERNSICFVFEAKRAKYKFAAVSPHQQIGHCEF